MDTLEVNIRLKEDITMLEKAYKEMVDAYQEKLFVPHTVHSNLKILSLICSEQVKAQRGEEASQRKFESVEKFAEYIRNMSDINMKWLEDKYGCK